MTPTVIPDTNFFMDYPEISKQRWSVLPLEIIISETVVNELEGLAKSSEEQTKTRAIKALVEIHALIKQSHLIDENPAFVTYKYVSRITDAKPPLDPQNPDHQIIAIARRLLTGEPPKFCAILTSDRELCDIAEGLSLIVIVPDPQGFKFQYEISRKHHWWNLAREAEKLSSTKEQGPKKERAKTEGQTSDRQDYLEQTLSSIYHRVRAEKHRTMLHLAPLQARIALTAKLIKRVPNPENRIVFVVVETANDARYWGQQIRKLGGFKRKDIHVFGSDKIDRLENTKAIIYHHEQAIRRSYQHIARFTQLNKHITALVDGCDLLDPAGLALFLFECDQFIGFHHSPEENSLAPGGRMLSTFLRNKSLLSYTFSDAEFDRWGHSCDLFLHPISFNQDEKDLWEKVNQDYLHRINQAMSNYPELKASDDFWGTLYKLLMKKVAPYEAKLFELREEREGIAQLAQGKLEVVKNLISNPPRQPYRRLVFDYEQQWSKLLQKHLPQEDAKVAVLPDDETQGEIWRDFIGNKYDTLVLSHIPDHDLPKGYYYQLIILTPLRPLTDLNAMINWALSHTQAKSSLRIELIYVKDTPEELATLSLAASSFGMNYHKNVNEEF